MSKIRHVATVCDDGRIRLIKETLPPVLPGTICVRVHASLVSPGTELGGWKQLAKKREQKESFGEGRKFGYSNSGIVEEVGEGVSRFRIGQRVACIGYGFALHTDFAIVPQNLCVELPDAVSFEQASYSMLLATSIQSVHRAEPKLGENVAVVGMGLVGQLVAQLHQACGNYVIGWARNKIQLDVARKWGIDEVVQMQNENAVEKTKEFTKYKLLDTAVLAFPGQSGSTWKQVCDSMKITPDGHRMGRVVIVGGSEIELKWIPANMDIRFAARTGPGYHDQAWELGQDYPSVLVERTTQDNLQLGIDLIARKKVDVNILTTHYVNLLDVTESIDAILDNPQDILGLVFLNK